MAPEDEQTQETAKPATEKVRLLETCLSSALFFLLFLLVSNVCVLIVARDINDAACRSALTRAAQEAYAGRDRRFIVEQALTGLKLRGTNSLFVDTPEFVEYKDTTMADGRHSLQMRTRVFARLPAPFLMPNAPFNSVGQLSISQVYQVGVKKPRQKADGDVAK